MSEPESLIETIRDLCWQFAYPSIVDGRPSISSGGLSALEGAFAALGWDDPHLLTEAEAQSSCCQIEGCWEQATCGQRWREFYISHCGMRKHGLIDNDTELVLKSHCKPWSPPSSTKEPAHE